MLQAKLPSRSAVLLVCAWLWGVGEVPFAPPASPAEAGGAGLPTPGREVSASGATEESMLLPAQRKEELPVVSSI